MNFPLLLSPFSNPPKKSYQKKKSTTNVKSVLVHFSDLSRKRNNKLLGCINYVFAVTIIFHGKSSEFSFYEKRVLDTFFAFGRRKKNKENVYVVWVAPC